MASLRRFLSSELYICYSGALLHPPWFVIFMWPICLVADCVRSGPASRAFADVVSLTATSCQIRAPPPPILRSLESNSE